MSLAVGRLEMFSQCYNCNKSERAMLSDEDERDIAVVGQALPIALRRGLRIST